MDIPNQNNTSTTPPVSVQTPQPPQLHIDNTPPTPPPPPPPSIPAVPPTLPSQPAKKHNGIPVPLIMLFLIFAFLGGLLLAGWYFQMQLQKMNGSQTSSSDKQTAMSSSLRTYIVGTDPTSPPMESINKQGGMVGYDIDLAYRLANEMGVKIEIRNVPWDNIFDTLAAKKIDMIISGVTITDERKQKFDFSDPYINAGQVIVSRKDAQIASTSALQGKKISVQKGTTNEEEAKKFTSTGLVLSYDKFEDAAKAVSDGKSDAEIADLTMAKGFVDEFPNLRITSDPFTNEYYGVVLHKGDTELLNKVNNALSVLKVKGILTDLKQKWLD